MDEHAQRSLFKWIQSFTSQVSPSRALHELSDLSDGVILSKIMHQIAPEYLNIEGINQNAEGNWALKSSNIRTLTRCIELFYREELGQICVAAEILDIQLVSKENNPQEIAKLVELILGCAVQCANKEIYIHPIMQMEAAEQAQLMHMIQNIIERFPQASPSPKGRSHHNSDFLLTLQETDGYDEKYRQVLEKISSLEIRNLDLEREKRELSDRLEHFSKDSQHWAEKVAVLEEQRDKLLTERQTSLARDNKKIQELVESEIHALSIQLEEKNDELNRVKRESGERFAHLENEVRRQADELDITKSKISQIGKLEASVAKYKKKLEEVTALKNQIKELEIHNAQYLEKVLDLESTVKTLPTLKAMVEKYKNQVVDLETANVEAISNNQIKDQKIRRLQEELDSALGGKEFLEGQLEELRTQLSGLQVAHSCDDSISMVGNSCSAADLLISTSSGESTMILREKIARLERENSELKLGNNLDPDNSHLLNELDMLRKAKESLHITMLQMKKQNEELLEENSQFKLGASKADGQAAAFSNYEEQISKLKENAESSDSMRATVQELTNRLKEKESVINDLSEQRAKLENYTKKTLHAVQTKYMVAVSSHRNQINEKQERVEFLEKKLKEMRNSYSREQALMMSALYEVGAEMQRRTMLPVQIQGSGPNSYAPTAWLANKRSEERARRRNL